MSKDEKQLSKFSAMCMVLPEAQRKIFGTHAEFRVRRKVFAYFLNDHHGNGIVSVSFNAPPGEGAERVAREPRRYYVPASVGRPGWFAVRLDRGRVNWQEIHDLLLRSYAMAAPRTLGQCAYREAKERAAQLAERKAKAKQRIATGTFRVDLTPQREPLAADGTNLGRMRLHKQFEGDLVGVGEGEMLSAVTATQGSAGYVAIERFVGTVHGRTGSFVLQHSGTMTRGAQSLSITVVPDSGSGELVGLTGRFSLRIDQGQHHYSFEYLLPAPGAPPRK